ncbi:MAG: YfhO family protein [Oscillospiraceae bacterium]|nr:YfhO family protein [Oscillospiraceae bacterium]
MKTEKSPLRKGLLARLPQILSFALPFLIVSIVFATSEIFPFGDRQILASDGWHQYYPFLLTLREKLRSGSSLEYIRNIGMGTNYVSLYAYYLASPLNFLCVLWPKAYMVEFYTLMTVLKISFAGLFFSFFLKIVYRKNDYPMAFFSLMYALCSWSMAYYWNIMWLDAFAVLPLLMGAMVCLLRDGKFRLYVLSLALCLWCNYYVAFFCCIFVMLSFFGYCLCTWNGVLNFLRRFFRIGVCTLLGAGLAAVLLIPTLTAMQYTYSAKDTTVELLAMNLPERFYGHTEELGYWGTMKAKVLPQLFPAIRQIFTRLLPGYEPASMDGLPNIFCGFSAVILSVFFFCNGKIRIREKIVSLLLLLFLVMSFIFRILDYIWHGFHFPNMLPYRFSFLVPFVIICMAYRAFSVMDNFKYWKLAVILPVSALFIISAYYIGDMPKEVLIASIAVICSVTAFFCFYGQKQLQENQRTNYAKIFLCFVILCEMILSCTLGIDKVGTSSHNNYPRNGEYVQSLMEFADDMDYDLYYRTEVTSTQTLNDGALNGYYGLSIFNSSANVNFVRFSRALGFASWPESNRTAYYETSPFGNTFAGLKYLIDRDGDHLSSANSFIAVSGNNKLLKNNHYLGLGFMTDINLSGFQSRAAQKNALLDQEEMFTLATGIDQRLYRHLNYRFLTADEGCTLVKSTSRTTFRFNKPEGMSTANFSITYQMEDSGLLLAYLHMPGADGVTVYRNGLEFFVNRPAKVRTLMNIGDVEEGDEIRFTFKAKSNNYGTITLDAALQNEGTFALGMNSLADETWQITEASDTYFCGTVDVRKYGLFYTAIPYEPGWTAYVDGVEVPLAATYDPSLEDVMLTDAVISFPLDEGFHIIELKYKAPGLKSGLLLSIASALIFIALCILLRKNPVLLPDVPPTKNPTKKGLGLWSLFKNSPDLAESEEPLPPWDDVEEQPYE